MSITPTFKLEDIMTNILTAIQDILGEIATVLAENASVVASVIVLGGLAFSMVRFGSRVMKSFTGLFRGIF